MFQNKIRSLVFLLCIYILSSAEGTCVLELPGDKSAQPKINLRLGRRAGSISNDNMHHIRFSTNAEFTAHCITTELMDSRQNTFSQNTIFQCKSNGTISQKHRCGYSMGYFSCHYEFIKYVTYLECAAPVLSMYESKYHFNWCKNDGVYGFFDLIVNNTIEQTKIAEICFKYETASPDRIKYFSAPKNLDHFIRHNRSMFNREHNAHDLEIPFENQMNSGIKFDFEVALDYVPTKENFEYGNLIQDGIIKELEAGKPTATIIWWHNLRVSNWKRYLDALKAQSEKSIYEVYAGTYGSLKIPGKNNSKDFKNIPAYVWNILKEVNGTEEFLIMGYNSPYFELFDKNETVLCEDICDRISWLEEIRHFFKISYYGRIFCCPYGWTLSPEGPAIATTTEMPRWRATSYYPTPPEITQYEEYPSTDTTQDQEYPTTLATPNYPTLPYYL